MSKKTFLNVFDILSRTALKTFFKVKIFTEILKYMSNIFWFIGAEIYYFHYDRIHANILINLYMNLFYKSLSIKIFESLWAEIERSFIIFRPFFNSHVDFVKFQLQSSRFISHFGDFLFGKSMFRPSMTFLKELSKNWLSDS